MAMPRFGLILTVFISIFRAANSSADSDNFSKVQIADAYQMDNGDYIVNVKYDWAHQTSENPSFIGINTLFYCKTQTCYQVNSQHPGGFRPNGGNGGTIEGKFNDAPGSFNGSFKADKKAGIYKLACGGVSQNLKPLSQKNILDLQSKIQKQTIKLTALPNVRDKGGIFKSGDDYIYADANKYKWRSEDTHIWTGQPGNMTQASVKGVDEYLDGGSIKIRTDRGDLFLPAGSRDEPMTWNGKPVEYAGDDVTQKSLGIPDVSEKEVLNTPCGTPSNKTSPPAPAGDASAVHDQN